MWVVRWNHRWWGEGVVDGWISCVGHFQVNLQSTALHHSYTTPQSFSLFPIPSMSLYLLIHSLFSSPSLSQGSSWVSLLNHLISTCDWWKRVTCAGIQLYWHAGDRKRDGGGGAGEKETEKGRKKQCPSETPLTEVQLALLWTKDVIILFKIMSENLR